MSASLANEAKIGTFPNIGSPRGLKEVALLSNKPLQEENGRLPSSPRSKIDAVVPLLSRDLDRFEVMAHSITANFRDLGTCWVVGLDGERTEIEPRIRQFPSFQFAGESEVVPELAAYRRLPRRYSRRITGWYVQQLIKLAIASRIATKHYLTLDADVICVRTVSFQDLVLNGKALVKATEDDIHPEWYANTAKVLGYPRPSTRTHGVTPALFDTEAVLKLQDFLAQRVCPPLRAAACIFGNGYSADVLAGWRAFLIRAIPWTEYSLYHGFLEGHGLAAKFHDYRRGALYDSEKSFWTPEELEGWLAQDLSDLAEDSYFIIAQSNTGVSPAVILRKVAPLIGYE